jgi:hypothetical protein
MTIAWIDYSKIPAEVKLEESSTEDIPSVEVFHRGYWIGDVVSEDGNTWIGYIEHVAGTDGDDTTDSYATPEEAILEVHRRSR